MSYTEWNGLDDDELRKLDLRRFNDGESPYSENDKSIELAYKDGRKYHEDMVGCRTGFAGGHRVLDLLCGYGRWAPFLASVCDEVVGVDRLPACTKLAKNYCDWAGFNNVSFHTGDWTIIREFPDKHFDRVWIWSGLQYVPRGEVLTEVNRLLSVKGKLFVGAYNSTGLMLQHLFDGVAQQRINEGASQWALSSLVNGPDGDGYPNYITIDRCEDMCRRFGFELVAVVPQGCLDIRQPSGKLPDCEGEILFQHHHRTVEFVADKVRDIGSYKTNQHLSQVNTILRKFARKLIRPVRT